MTWNYRIIKKNQELRGKNFGIYKVYYDENNNMKLYTKSAVTLIDDSLEDFKKNIELIKKAFDLPILNMEDLSIQILTYSERGKKGSQTINSNPEKRKLMALKAVQTRLAKNPDAFKIMGKIGGSSVRKYKKQKNN